MNVAFSNRLNSSEAYSLFYKGSSLSHKNSIHSASILHNNYPVMPRLGIYLTMPQVRTLKQISTQTGLAVSELIRRSLDDWLEKYEEKERRKTGENSTHPVTSILK